MAVRIRPFNDKELGEKEPICLEVNKETIRVFNNIKNPRTFTFDHIFWSLDESNADANPPRALQACVYERVQRGVVDDVLEGFNYCLFAYGQTGSGKSFSMMGSPDSPGITPRLISDLFAKINNNSDEKRSFTVEFSMLEIYNEKIKDLLKDSKKNPNQSMKIKLDKHKNFYVHNLRWEETKTLSDVLCLLERGNRQRSISATLMNAHSSRAHTLVTLRIRMQENVYGNTISRWSEMHLVDLAGSEKVGRTGVQGRHLREGCHINKSLTTLGRVITILAEKAAGKKKQVVIPYRESPLTMILKNALGGNSKTLMLCTLSPAMGNFEETLSTLHYANQAKRIRCHAVINESGADREIRLLKQENERLRSELGQMKDEMEKIRSREVSFNKNHENSFSESKEQKKKKWEELRSMFEENQFKLKSIVRPKKLVKGFNSAIHLKPSSSLNAKLINIRTEQMMNRKLVFDLTKLGEVQISRSTKDGKWKPNQILCDSPGIREDHGQILWENGRALIEINAGYTKAQREAIVVNNKILFGGRTQLEHRDVLIIGKKLVFVYCEKGQTIAPEDFPKFDSCLRRINTRTRTIIEDIDTVESAFAETIGEDLASQNETHDEPSPPRPSFFLPDGRKTSAKVFDEDETQKIIETGNNIFNRKQLSWKRTKLEKEIDRKVKKMNAIALKNGRDLRLSSIECEWEKGVVYVRVDNFDLGYAYVWETDDFKRRSAKCLRQKKTMPRAQIQRNMNTPQDPFWSEMKFVYLGEASLDLTKDLNFLGDLQLNYKNKKGFVVMVELRMDGDSASLRAGKMRGGWMPIVKYYLKIEWQRQGRAALKKLRSEIFDIPQKKDNKNPRKDVFEREFKKLTKDHFGNSSDFDDQAPKLVIKAYGVIAAQCIFKAKELSESILGWKTEEPKKVDQKEKKAKDWQKKQLKLSQKNSITDRKIGEKSLKEDKPCCVIF